MINNKKQNVKYVSTGLGIPNMLTIEAYNAIENADVIIIDNIINKTLISKIKHHGKVLEFNRVEEKKLPIKFSNLTSSIIKLFHEGKKIVRLKIGDILLFGETELETKLLTNANIPIQIIPGLSAGAIAASHFGISITAKPISNAVMHVIGTEFLDTNKLNNYSHLINSGTTIIIYMPEKISETIINNLLDYKTIAETPLAIVSNLYAPNETIIHTTLNNSLKQLKKNKLKKPYIIFIGRGVSTIT